MDETLDPLDFVVDRFAKELVQERIDDGHLDEDFGGGLCSDGTRAC